MNEDYFNFEINQINIGFNYNVNIYNMMVLHNFYNENTISFRNPIND